MKTCKPVARRRLVIVETHPIQYKAPLFRLLAADPRLDPIVCYAMIPDRTQQGDGFGVSFAWDLPLLEGYRYEVLENVAREPSVTRFDGCDTPDLHARLKELQPDAVMVNGWVAKTCLQALWACRRLGIPCLVRGEANLNRSRAAWKHLLHRLLLSQYQAFLYIGSANQAFYRFHRRPDHQLFFAPYAVDNERFHREALSRVGCRDMLRRSFGMPEDAVSFLFCGKLEEKKRPGDVLLAMAALPESLRRRAHALMVGEGPLRKSLEAIAARHDLKVTFAGFRNQSELPDVYAAADALVLPSDSGETWGLVVNEAMASLRPAVVSRSAGCCADLIVEGETGHAYDCGDTEGLAAVFRGYLEQECRADVQGRAAWTRVSQYGYRQIADGIVAAMDQLAIRNHPEGS